MENETKKLSLACGDRKPEGYIGVDYKAIKGVVDVVCDLEVFPWPFEDNSIDEIECSHYIEHTKDIIKFMEELYRIMKVGAKATIIAPYYSSIRAWQDPTHTRVISEAVFLYYNKQWRIDNKLEHYDIKPEVDFDFTYGYSFSPLWANKNEEARNFAVIHYNNVVTDIIVNLTKKEPK